MGNHLEGRNKLTHRTRGFLRIFIRCHPRQVKDSTSAKIIQSLLDRKGFRCKSPILVECLVGNGVLNMRQPSFPRGKLSLGIKATLNTCGICASCGQNNFTKTGEMFHPEIEFGVLSKTRAGRSSQGAQLNTSNWQRFDIVRTIHRSYTEAGTRCLFR